MIGSQAQAARDLLETLYRGGVRDAVISPGSRNTPLVLAAEALSGLRKTVVLDERSAAFLALGMSRCSALVNFGLLLSVMGWFMYIGALRFSRRGS